MLQAPSTLRSRSPAARATNYFDRAASHPVLYHLSITLSATAVAALASSVADASFWMSIAAAAAWIVIVNAALLLLRSRH
jgi:hypothetical protein